MSKGSKIKKVEHLYEQGLINENKISELTPVVERFSLSITKQMVDLIDSGCHSDPIAKQFIPDAQELNIIEEELVDPIGDDTHSTVKGIVHRYPDRCLLMPMTVCPVYCRFCFRREKVGSSGAGLNKKELDNALKYIEEKSEIWEVILSGGDPLFMSPKLIKNIIQRLSVIDHVEVIRIHTRVPVVDSSLINEAMFDALKTSKALYIVLHTNHAKEITPLVEAVIAKIVDNGIPMLSQSVLLKGVNDDSTVLEALFRKLVKNRVKPYYLHQGDYAKGTSHFRTSIEKGQELMKALRGSVSGLCQPTYTLDIPGGQGKVPINPNYLTALENKEGITVYNVEDYQGNFFQYPPSPSM